MLKFVLNLNNRKRVVNIVDDDKNDNPSIITTKTAVISTIAIFIPPYKLNESSTGGSQSKSIPFNPS